MPMKPNKPCRHPGCARLVPSGRMYCDEHRRLHPEHTRSAAKRGYGSKWQRESKAYLAAHPTCVMCGARATVVDHIVPHRGDSKLFWDRKNWQSLCKSCHDKKTGRFESLPTYKY